MRKELISERFPHKHLVNVTVGGARVQQTVRSRVDAFEFEASGLPKAKYSLRLFRPGSEVLNALVDEVFERAHAGNSAARIRYVTFIVEQYLPKPTYRRISVTALKRARLIPRGVDAASAVSAALDAATTVKPSETPAVRV